MKKLVCLALALLMLCALCACGAKDEAPAAAPAAPAAAAPDAAAPAAPAANSVAGAYTYTENNGMMDITWTLTLNADGTMVLGEVNELFPEGESYAGSYTANGNTVSCTFGESSPNVYIWAAPTGFTATLNGNAFTPNIPTGASLTTNEMASAEVSD